MRIISATALISLLAIVYLGCGGSKSLQSTGEGDIPTWMMNPPSDPNYLYAAKSATSTDMQTAIDKAANEGRADIARQMETKVSSLEKRFREEVGVADNAQYLDQFTQANKQVVSTVLIGSKVKEQKFFKDGTAWRSYVLMELPLGAAKEAMLQNIKNNEQMYTRFRATQTFKELDDDVAKFEQWKKDQGGK